ERVLEALLELFPDAAVHTLVHRAGSVSPAIEARKIHTSFLQRLPWGVHHYRHYLPLLPRAVESLNVTGSDLVVSTSHAVAKGVRPGAAPHLCYCHTPMRWAWDQHDEYFGPGRASLPVRIAARAVMPGLRRWDVRTAARVHRFVANSAHVRERIGRVYGRAASVVHPPVDVDRFRPAPRREDFYLVVSALVAYKRVDRAVDACTRLGRRLVVVGDGPGLGGLQARAGPSVIFAGRVPDPEVARLMGRCRALLLPGVEDFGIAVVEARAAGAPVVALGAGGALETVTDLRWDPEGGSGLLITEPTVDAFCDALRLLERLDPDPARVRAGIERWRKERFLAAMADEVEALTGRRPPGWERRQAGEGVRHRVSPGPRPGAGRRPPPGGPCTGRSGPRPELPWVR
ncbi:MAG TPA: glycosyltransferase, partial [Longimicrobiales bacterium]|nr:glycosyltransferase [Longimicrobiales bacterium]